MATSQTIMGMRKPFFWIGLIGMLLAIPTGWVLLHFAAHSTRPPAVVEEKPAAALPQMATLPAFSLTDQDGKPYTLDRMRGHVSIVDFIFTRCQSVCPLLSQKMAGLQKRTQKFGSAVQLVSFSVDPDHDTPAVLKAYGARYARDPARWTFVTGEKKALEGLIEGGFKIGLTNGGGGAAVNFGVIHGQQFVLVDAQGTIRGYYHKEDLARLVSDAVRLARQDTTLGQR